MKTHLSNNNNNKNDNNNNNNNKQEPLPYTRKNVSLRSCLHGKLTDRGYL